MSDTLANATPFFNNHFQPPLSFGGSTTSATPMHKINQNKVISTTSSDGGSMAPSYVVSRLSQKFMEHPGFKSRKPAKQSPLRGAVQKLPSQKGQNFLSPQIEKSVGLGLSSKRQSGKQFIEKEEMRQMHQQTSQLHQQNTKLYIKINQRLSFFSPNMLNDIKQSNLPQSPQNETIALHDTQHESMFSQELQFSSRSSSREKRHSMVNRMKNNMAIDFRRKNMSSLLVDTSSQQAGYYKIRPSTRMESNMFSELHVLHQSSANQNHHQRPQNKGLQEQQPQTIDSQLGDFRYNQRLQTQEFGRRKFINRHALIQAQDQNLISLNLGHKGSSSPKDRAGMSPMNRNATTTDANSKGALSKQIKFQFSKQGVKRRITSINSPVMGMGKIIRPSTVASTPLDIKYAILKQEPVKKRREIQVPVMAKREGKSTINAESMKLLSITEILNQYKSPQKDENRTLNTSDNQSMIKYLQEPLRQSVKSGSPDTHMERPQSPEVFETLKRLSKNMSRYTVLENILSESKISQYEEKVTKEEQKRHGSALQVDSKQVKDQIKKTRIDLKRTQNVTNNILTWKGKGATVNLRTGPRFPNEFSITPGVPALCKIDIANKPQPCTILTSGVIGDLFIFASTIKTEPNESDNQGSFTNEYKLTFFQNMGKLTFSSDTPSMSSVSTYGKYSLPLVYLAFEATEVCNIKITILFGFDALRKPEDVIKAEEEAKALADEGRIHKRRVKDTKKAKKPVATGPDKMQETKTGGAIWRAEFLTALREAQSDKPMSTTGTVLHALSSDAEFEAYFKPLMSAYSKWVIEYNVAQLLQKEDYLPRFFKIIQQIKSRLKDYRVEKMIKAMNLTNYKNFLINNIDEQAEWPQLMQQRLDEKAKELDERILQVNARKEHLEESQRQKITEFAKRWDIFKNQAAIRKEEQRLEGIKQNRKHLWMVILTNHSVLRDQFYAKFKQMVDARDWQLDIIRVTRSIVYALKRIVRRRGKTFDDRQKGTMRHTFASFALQYKDNYEERAKAKIRSFLEGAFALSKLHGAFFKFKRQIEFLQNRVRHNKKVMEQHKALLKKYFDREKSRIIMTKMPTNAKDKDLQQKLQDLVQGIQQRLPDYIRNQIIDDYYKIARESFIAKYKHWLRTTTAEQQREAAYVDLSDIKAVTSTLFVSRKVRNFRDVEYELKLTPEQISVCGKMSGLVMKKYAASYSTTNANEIYKKASTGSLNSVVGQPPQKEDVRHAPAFKFIPDVLLMHQLIAKASVVLPKLL
ncbi:hypothetical protein FGO68_gene9239 [Halteria grandinella]|uniref:Uncharacterized protein n=1 Tax=Halteria grandinella TaxID=5974 RepID=A0A8J8P2N3_HALGN|nr:hypothetical protein FGO68_gene9239 [Halteria grandinella]